MPAGEMVADAVAAYEASDPDACRGDRHPRRRPRRAVSASQRGGRPGLLEADRARIEANGAPEADSGHLADALDDVSRALLAIRDLERVVGDHAVNIAARTLFMIESDDELIY